MIITQTKYCHIVISVEILDKFREIVKEIYRKGSFSCIIWLMYICNYGEVLVKKETFDVKIHSVNTHLLPYYINDPATLLLSRLIFILQVCVR